ncbi:MAG: T9SS type A sorting domain-containing protein [Saprospiraceae bacterium]
MRQVILLLLLFLAFSTHLQSQSYAQMIKSVADDRSLGNSYGGNVDISGEFAIIGSYSSTDENNANSKSIAGAAYILYKDQGGTDNWGQLKKLVASDRQEWDYFGDAVAISGDYAIVGAHSQHYDENGANEFNNSGAAYIFYRHQGGTNNWGEVTKIVASDRTDYQQFAQAVSISGNIVAVGTYQEKRDASSSNGLNQAGAVYIFSKDQGGTDNWGQVTKIDASDRNEWDQFGFSVDISGNNLVVGAPQEDENQAGSTTLTNSGSAYIFSKDQGGSNNWGQVTKIVASDRASYDAFGYSVSISGENVVLGAYFEDVSSGSSTDNAGAAYIFSKDQGGSSNWGQVTKINASDWTSSDYFGFSVSISGDFVISGAFQEDDDVNGNNPLSKAGSAYVFYKDQGGSNNWGQINKLVSNDRGYEDELGINVAISGDYALVGAHYDDEDENDQNLLNKAGSAYIFKEGYVPPPPVYLKYYANSATGDDSNPGTSALPFKTFHTAYTAAGSLDTINLAGTFDWTDASETGDVSSSGYQITKSILIEGQGRDVTFIQAASTFNTADRKVFSIYGTEIDVTIKNLTIRNGKTSTQGGGIRVYNINSFLLESCDVAYNSIYSNSSGVVGGGIYIYMPSAKSYVIDKCNIYNNIAETDAVDQIATSGGAYLAGTVGSEYTITNTSIYNNQSNAATDSLGRGAAIELFFMSDASFTNCTISNNTQSGKNGTILISNILTNFAMTNCTVVENESCQGFPTSLAKDNGGLYIQSTTAQLKNNIIANNTYNGIGQDFNLLSGASLNDNGYNLVEFSQSTFSGTGSITGDQTNLFGTGISATPTLEDNNTLYGSKTIAITTGSVAIEAAGSGMNNTIAIPTMDQRGVSRATMDIGAFYFDVSLPVEFTNFTAQATENKTVNLKWLTASELNNSHFEIERSADGLDWKYISEVAGTGTTSVMTTYLFEDRDPLEINYYRLKQVDFDGAYEYSPIRVVKLSKTEAINNFSSISVFPTPASDFVNIHVESGPNIKQIELYDISGKQLLLEQFNIGTQFKQLDISNLKNGVYLLSVQSGFNSTLIKIVKQ